MDGTNCKLDPEERKKKSHEKSSERKLEVSICRPRRVGATLASELSRRELEGEGEG